MDKVKAELEVSERRACAVLRQPRSTQRKAARGRDDEAALTADIIELAKAYGRYGYRRITALLRRRLGREPQARAADLATGGAESPAETTKTGSSLAE